MQNEHSGNPESYISLVVCSLLQEASNPYRYNVEMGFFMLFLLFCLQLNRKLNFGAKDQAMLGLSL